MKKISYLIAAAWCCAALTAGAQRSGAPQSTLTDWVTDGGDNQRTGWARDEKILTKDNVKNLRLLWTMPTENQPRALHSLMPVLVIGQLNTSSGRIPVSRMRLAMSRSKGLCLVQVSLLLVVGNHPHHPGSFI